MFRGYSLLQKEVISVDTAERMGYVSDVEISERTGNIEAFVVRRRGWFLTRIFGGEMIIPWSAIEVVGDDLILVRIVNIVNET